MVKNTPEVLYEDNHLLAVVKTAGVLTQGDATGDVSLLDLCKEYVRIAYAKPGQVYLGLVHRLDRPVSGVLLFARTSKAAARLAEQFRTRTVRKIYWAVVEGRPPAAAGTLVHYLTGNAHRLKSAVSDKPRANAKRAELRYRELRHQGERTLVEVELLTGYKHQIRAQLAGVGCPVAGDFKYDRRQAPAEVTRLYDGRAIALHAIELVVLHPTQKEPVTLKAPLPAYWPLAEGVR